MKRTIGCVACVLLAVACGSSPDAPPAGAAGTAPGAAPGGETKPGGANPDGGSKPDKKEAPPVTGTPVEDELTEKFGVFVTPQGSDDGDGTRNGPYATIAKGIEAGAKDGKRVYVCMGTYREALTLSETISVIGGLDCSGSTWHAGKARSVIESPSSPALRATDLVKATRFDGFDVSSPDATEPSASSIGLLANRSPGLTVANARIHAGAGANGTDGVDGVQLVETGYPNGGTPEPVGPFCVVYPARCDAHVYKKFSGTYGGTSKCSGAPGHDGESGGGGGSGGVYRSVTFGGNVWEWAAADDQKLNPANAAEPGGFRTGTAGAPGKNGNSGGGGALSASGFVAASGTAGTDGAPGKGGKGGDGVPPFNDANKVHTELWAGSGGGGGGAGGCPGLAGTPGTGGGASIAALLVQSAVTFEKSELESSSGGAGGHGTFGSSASPGGLGGILIEHIAGSRGGDGGASGVSGSGAGGPSFAIAHTGGAPKVTSTTTTSGTGGAGVPADSTVDAVGNSKTIPASANGASESVHAF